MPIDPAAKVGYLQLIVRDLDREIDYYTRGLGFTVLKEAGGRVWLGPEGGAEFLVIKHDPQAAPPGRAAGLYHFAVLFPTRADLARTIWRLADAGFSLQGASDHGVSEALYMADPEGNGIELYRDRPMEEWNIRDGRIRMVTDPLDLDALLSLSSQAEGRASRPSGETRLGHMHLKVSNLDRAERFYVDSLGFTLKQHYGTSAAFVAAGDYHHHIGMNTWESAGAPRRPAGSTGLDYFTVLLPDQPALTRTIEEVRQTGLQPEETPAGWMLTDPDGIGVVLTC